MPGSKTASPQPANPPDVLGRATPRGTVLGFLKAARKGDDQLAAQYLNTRLRGKDAAKLAHQLFVVLDLRLPARLNELSDRPEGSLPFLTRPDEDLVGTILNGGEQVEILVEKVAPEKKDSVWLFSSKTLAAVPGLFNDASPISLERVLPEFLVRTRIANVALFEWLGIFVGLPLLYSLMALLNRGLSPWIGRLRRRIPKYSNLPDPVLLPKPVRLLCVGLIIWWLASAVALSLFARQFWAGVAAAISIISCVWLLILANGWGEGMVRRYLDRVNKTGATSILRLGRRTIDLFIIVAGLLVGLRYFGVNPTAALAGLGVGGIAVALAAQKTLENVIGGVSIIFDQAVRVGETVITVSTTGVVEYIGLRSIRIRTADRTVVSVPNGQLANALLENVSARDKFRFQHSLGLRGEINADTMTSVVEGVGQLLAQHTLIEGSSARVHFIRFGPSSLDIEVFAYILARDWVHFLDVQEDLLLQVMRIVNMSGAQIALPSQTVYLGADSGTDSGRLQVFANKRTTQGS